MQPMNHDHYSCIVLHIKQETIHEFYLHRVAKMTATLIDADPWPFESSLLSDTIEPYLPYLP